MNALVRNITAIAMAAIVLFSTMSFSVDMHYCGDHLVDFSFFDTVDTCLMKSEKVKSSPTCSVMEMKMDCCSDVVINIEGQDDLKLSLDQITLYQQAFITSFTFAYLRLFEEGDTEKTAFKDYIPPPLIKDFQVLDQTFLI